MNKSHFSAIRTAAISIALCSASVAGCGGGGGGGDTSSTGTGTGAGTGAGTGTTTTNLAPVVSCPAVAPASVGSKVQLSCEVSDDTKSASTLNYTWEVTPPPSVSASVTPVVANGANTGAEITPAAPGTYTLKLTVSDGQASTVATVSFKTRWRILPLGDSITQGSSTEQSYRYQLWKSLVDQGAAFEFVGSMTTNFGTTPASFPDYKGLAFPNRHEGHYGARADEIVSGRINQNGDNEGNLTTWLQAYTPDIVLVHLGTNDTLQGQTSASTVTDLASIISALKLDNDKVRVYVAQIIPTSNLAAPSVSVDVAALNTSIAALASSATIVDQFSGFGRETDTIADNIHPNTSGDAKIAQKWYDAIKGVVQ